MALVNVTTAVSTQTTSPPTPVKNSFQEKPQPASLLPEKSLDPETIQMFSASLNKLNARLQKSSTELRFTRDQSTGRVVFKILDKDGITILQVPAEELLALAHKLKELDKSDEKVLGILLDKEG